MNIYLHDGSTSFQFVLEGDLTAEAARSLEHAWITATSILSGKEVVVDVSGLSTADAEGVELLHRMTASGARLSAALLSRSADFLRSCGLPIAAPPRRPDRPWFSNLRRLFGLAA
jgi:ABC-type transporter Mla MlaB component